jgi:hypothetical protein
MKDDDFLTRFRKSPPQEFSEALYKRINVQMNTKRTPSLRRLTFAAALGMALIAALAFSPRARAAFNGLIVEIGEMIFMEPDETARMATPLPESQITLVPEEILPLAEAQAKLPFSIRFPTWVPDGFVRSNSVRISYFPNITQAIITWSSSNPRAAIIELMIMDKRVNWVVETDNVHELQVNGQPAALVGGGWDAETGQWDSGADLSLSWMKDEQMYRLSSPGTPVEDLIRMAESIP